MISKTINAKRIVIAIAAAAACCFAMWQSVRAGIARTLGEYAIKTSDIDAAEQAVRSSPADAEPHAVRGIVMQQAENYADAQFEMERAVQLRPRDYQAWMLLGITRDENQDQAGAAQAFRQSIALAPAYAQPRWQLGNLLLRMNQTDEAFGELRLAARSDPALLPNLIDLAWGVYRGDLNAVMTAVPLQNSSARIDFALFLARHQRPSAAVDQFMAAAEAPRNKSEGLLAELLRARAFGDAYRVWARVHGAVSADSIATIRNADFEEPIDLAESGFGWQIAPDVRNVVLSVDPTEHHGGAKSLRIDFRGDSIPSQPLITQLVLVKPDANYRLRFAAMSREMISAGLPVVVIRDASDAAQPMLAQSSTLGSNANSWQEFSIDFKTGAKTEAILISIERQVCATPCPAFGTLWLDAFGID